MSRSYYTLVVSLPRLPSIEQAERLPITPLRLEQRLHMLDEDDAAQLARVRPLIDWRRTQLRNATDAEAVRKFQELLTSPLCPSLREYVEFRIDQMTILAAMRRRKRGEGPPSSDVAWGAGTYLRQIAEHWKTPDFNLSIRQRWVTEALHEFETGDARNLERVLKHAAWRKLDQLAARSPFGFEAVFAFVFKWDMLQSWLAHDPIKATERFRQLVQEVTHDEQN